MPQIGFGVAQCGVDRKGALWLGRVWRGSYRVAAWLSRVRRGSVGYGVAQ